MDTKDADKEARQEKLRRCEEYVDQTQSRIKETEEKLRKNAFDLDGLQNTGKPWSQEMHFTMKRMLSQREDLKHDLMEHNFWLDYGKRDLQIARQSLMPEQSKAATSSQIN
ncbi:uncharacterized protein K489DRAFT_176451 [Dissoconium aciculare CBS 342.82]|uniref:Uncharacterized protein n=1 Tax=Dissoconium aciculare CBS 342.82 TaxID=1314786 RepID=A0A6J3MBI2_9PEZI|nr:uncharacterized protein K489DRAFT_176451 [Dissoconium aciculare CBS 342.82]KAF1824197.1 hypothetical protein K489DRAFT_176451 [Dissoconium aciculare CBS 342.82]